MYGLGSLDAFRLDFQRSPDFSMRFIYAGTLRKIVVDSGCEAEADGFVCYGRVNRLTVLYAMEG